MEFAIIHRADSIVITYIYSRHIDSILKINVSAIEAIWVGGYKHLVRLQSCKY